MGVKDVATVQAYHRDRIRNFGAGSCQSLGWKSEDSQRKRFLDLSEIGDLHGSNVLDVGCGYGDLFPVLKEKYGEFSYTGIENVHTFLEVAVRRFGEDSNARFFLGEFGSMDIPVVDYVLCSGSLSYRNSDPEYLYNMISKLFGSASIGLGLNLLSKVDFEDGVLVSCDPDDAVDFCRRLTPHVEIKADSDKDFFTLFLYHEKHQG